MIHGPKKTVSLLLPLELHTQLSQLAQKSCRTLPGYIRQILKLHIQEQTKEAP